jgi:hypothetical protein
MPASAVPRDPAGRHCTVADVGTGATTSSWLQRRERLQPIWGSSSFYNPLEKYLSVATKVTKSNSGRNKSH